MLRSLCAVLSFLIAFGCAEGGAVTYEKREFSMPIPPYHQMVGPAVGAPFREIESPSDDAPVEAADIRRPTAALLANDVWIQREIFTNYDASAHAVGPTYAFGAPYIFSTAAGTWVDSPLFVDISAVEQDDDLIVHAFGNWQFNTSSTTNVVTKVRLAVIEDFGGANTLIPMPGTHIIVDNSPGGPTLPRNQNYALSGIHRVATTGDVRVIVQGIAYDLTGGAGTGTATMMHDNRMTVRHHNRKVN